MLHREAKLENKLKHQKKMPMLNNTIRHLGAIFKQQIPSPAEFAG
jgi:hypothetical protein